MKRPRLKIMSRLIWRDVISPSGVGESLTIADAPVGIKSPMWAKGPNPARPSLKTDAPTAA